MATKTKTYGNHIFARNFRLLMFEKKLTLREISERTNYPLSTVSTWKRGRVPRGEGTLERLAEFFGVGASELLSAELGSARFFSNERPAARRGSSAEISKCVEIILSRCRTKRQLERVIERLRSAFAGGGKKKVAKRGKRA